ncbi:IclR family transcriptional regulator [Variovorax sp. PBL-E5]|uniref:IclR family transcriptional regulator n=1 Tax=Variovorax sp. PBL-E5 TaxID=434014 RepID=UPI001317F74B|nr:IclR family transcriptional regulator [Variovorax sp. PBL-E5]VTU33720.1 Pectin degradation repressor protein KdgR [Variovorax sp. PBL-E5]
MTRSARSAAAVLSQAPTSPPEESASGSSAERSLRLLALLANEGRALSLADLAARLSLPKGTAHRICAQLLAGGFLARDVDERSFSVGPALRQLAFDTLNHGVVRGLRHEVLAELVRQVGETCNFTTIDGVQVLYLDRVEAQWPLRLTLDVGSHVPLHCTASGKLFLARLPPAERDALIERITLTRMTANTITSAAKLRAECDAIAKQGYSCDREEFIAGLIAVAVPVAAASGEVRAAIAVHAPTARMTLDDAVERIDALRSAAARMGGLL